MAAGRRKVIITCAVTGSSHPPSMAARPPAGPGEVAEQAIEAARAGAAILHFHARDHALLDRLMPMLAAETDAIISIATGSDPSAPQLAGLAHPPQGNPELRSLSMASPTPPGPDDAARSNPTIGAGNPTGEGSETRRRDAAFGDVRSLLTCLADAPETRFAFECHELGHLDGVKQLVDEAMVEPPVFLQFGLGKGRGLAAEPESLSLLRAAADRLFGRENHEFSVFAAGRQQMAVVTLGAIWGGHVRVGLEDGPAVSRGPLAMACSAQVLKVRRILDELSLAVASPAEAREILRISGAAKGAFDA